MKHYPKLHKQVIFRSVEDNHLLFHKTANTQLRLDKQEKEVAILMNGKMSLEELELQLVSPKHILAYSDLIVLLFRLWDRGMLENGDEIQQAFFPHRTHRTLDKAQSWKKIKWLFTFTLWLPKLNLLRLNLLGAICASTVGMVSGFVTGLLGIFLYKPDNMELTLGWFLQLLMIYCLAGIIMSIRGVVRGSIMSHFNSPSPRAGFRWSAGLIFYDVDERESFHLSRQQQWRFVLGWLAMMSLIAGTLAILGHFQQTRLLSQLSVVTFVLLFLDLCPFFSTGGSRLLELISGVKKQKFRVRSFIKNKLILGIFSSDANGSSFYWVTCFWLVWFFAALKIFQQFFISQISPIQIAIYNAQTKWEAILLAMATAYGVLLSLSFILAMLLVLSGMVTQILRSPGKPKREKSPLSKAEKASLIAQLQSLPLFSRLNKQSISELIDICEMQQLLPGTLVTDTDRFYYVIKGALNLCKHLPEGGLEVLGQTKAGDHCGTSFMSDGIELYQAAEQSWVLTIDNNNIKSIIKQTNEKVLQERIRLARLLKQSPILSGLNPNSCLELAKEVFRRRINKNEIVIEQNAPSDSMFIVLSGSFQVIRNKRSIAILRAGDSFGEIGPLLGVSRTATVRASNASELLEIPQLSLRHILHENFQIGLAIEQLAAQRMEKP